MVKGEKDDEVKKQEVKEGEGKEHVEEEVVAVAVVPRVLLLSGSASAWD